MVHALNNSQRALTTNGLLVDIHPTPDPREIFCATPEGERLVGVLRGSRERYRAADASLDAVVKQGLLRLLHTEVFHFMHYAASLRVLRAYLPGEFKRMWMDGATERRIVRLLGARGVGTISIDERVRISVLTPCGRLAGWEAGAPARRARRPSRSESPH